MSETELIYTDITKVLYMMKNHVGVNDKPLRFECYSEEVVMWINCPYFANALFLDGNTFRVHPDDVAVFNPRNEDKVWDKKSEIYGQFYEFLTGYLIVVTLPHGCLEEFCTESDDFSNVIVRERNGKEWLSPCEIKITDNK
jgi:hypothetical protein